MLPSLISSLFGVNLNSKKVVQRKKKRSIIHFFGAERVAKIFTLSNETISAWEIEKRKYHVCGKVEFKVIKELGGTEIKATSDEEHQVMRDRSEHVMNNCNGN